MIPNLYQVWYNVARLFEHTPLHQFMSTQLTHNGDVLLQAPSATVFQEQITYTTNNDILTETIYHLYIMRNKTYLDCIFHTDPLTGRLTFDDIRPLASSISLKEVLDESFTLKLTATERSLLASATNIRVETDSITVISDSR